MPEDLTEIFNREMESARRKFEKRAERIRTKFEDAADRFRVRMKAEGQRLNSRMDKAQRRFEAARGTPPRPAPGRDRRRDHPGPLTGTAPVRPIKPTILSGGAEALLDP